MNEKAKALRSGTSDRNGHDCALLEPEPMTLTNLRIAYGAEENAHIKYLAFATSSEEEGYRPVASLLRAAARAAELQAGNYADLTRGLDASPAMCPQRPLVKSATKNLWAAIDAGIYERDEMYPRFVSQAQHDGIATASNIFRFAQAMEAEHAMLLGLILHELDGRGGEVLCTRCVRFAASQFPNPTANVAQVV